MRYLVIILLLVGCQTTKTVKTDVVKYPDGKTKTITQKIVKKNKEFELHENFREESTVVREYFRNGKLHYKTTHTYHSGMDYPCREALYQLDQYDSTGIKRLHIYNECDCHKQTEITYNNKGEILVKWHQLIKRLY